MTVKRFVGPNIQEVVRRIQKDLGSEAILVNTEWRRKGLMGKLFGQQQVEVWAAVPENGNGSRPVPAPSSPGKDGTEAGSPEARPSSLLLEPQLLALLSYFGECLQHMDGRLTRLTQGVDRATAGLLSLDTEAHELQDHLLAQGFAPEVARDLAEQVGPRSVVELLAEGFKTTGPLLASGSPGVIALVGPTGVGKTTTIAKLAAQSNLMENARTALITFDMYRLAAVEQLQAYADLMDLPLTIAQTPAEAAAVVRQARQNYDFVFIDTFGCNPRNEEQMRQLRAFLHAAEPDSVQLVLSAVAKLAALDEALARFGSLSSGNGGSAVPLALLFSKVDETAQFGSLASLAWRNHRPVSYLTTGPNVPQDLVVADPHRLAEMAVSGF